MFIEAGLFFVGVESWKWCKRVYFRRKARGSFGADHKNMDVEDRVFGRYYTTEVGISQESTKEKV